MAFNRKQKMRDNIEAVRTAFTLDRERRTPTERERALFGGLKCILNPARELADAARWAKSDLELFAPTVELHRIIRENSKDETEYKRYVDSLKASVLTAFYTPKAITDTIADVLHDKKVRPNLVLEPSAGMGAFIGAVGQPAGGGDGLRERPADGQDAGTPVPAAEDTHGGLREDRKAVPEPF